MPIYEFYCSACHTIFSFLSRTINTEKRPSCPRCSRPNLERRVSLFAVTGQAKEDKGGDDLPLDESRMEKAMESLAGEMGNINEDDPRQAAQLMRKLSDMTGLQYGQGMQEALTRMEAGEDPEKIEQEMGGALENEDPFITPEKRARVRGASTPLRDENLYDL